MLGINIDDEHVVKINSSGARLYVSTSFGGKTKISLLFDTGATVSLLSETAFNKAIKAGAVVAKCEGPPPRIRNASGTDMEVRGVYSVTTTIMGQTMVAAFIVAPEVLGHGLIGMNLIRDFRLGVHPDVGIFQADTKDAPQVAAVMQEQVQDGDGELRFVGQTHLVADTYTLVRVKAFQHDGQVIRNKELVCAIVADLSVAIKTNEHGIAHVYVANKSTEAMNFARGERLGSAEYATRYHFLSNERVEEVSTIRAARENKEAKKKKIFPLDPKQVEAAIDDTNHAHQKTKYKQLIHKYEDIVSRDKHDLGLSSTIVHNVELSDNTPVYTQQYRLPLEQLNLVKEHLAAWIKSGIVERSNSKYNSPVFCVPKKEGHGLRVVLDYRKLNAKSLPDKYSIKSVDQCLEEVGRAESKVFSCIDLRSGFWQLKLAEEARHLTAFTIPGVGQFQYCVAPMGLAGSPASFSRLMDLVMKDLTNVITYIDDCLVHSKDHTDHLKHLEESFLRMRKHGLKINLSKCKFATPAIQYLGHTITGTGVKPGQDKARAVKESQPPSTVKQVRSFVGLCNYFRGFIPDFARRAAPLFALTRQDCKWRGGELPEDAKRAFEVLRKAISEEPVLAFPTAKGVFHMYVDASLGDDKVEGGLGAVLMQQTGDEQKRVIGYASRRLIKHEKNYPAFLIELQAAVYGMEQFEVHLRGRKFVMYSDHKPICRLGTAHAKTLNRLQLKMLEMFPEIRHVPGKDNPVADFLSRYSGMQRVDEANAVSQEDECLTIELAHRIPRHAIDRITIVSNEPAYHFVTEVQDAAVVDAKPDRLRELQSKDPVLGPIRQQVLESRDPTKLQKVKGTRQWVTSHQGILMAKIPDRKGELETHPGLLIMAPKGMRRELITEAHNGKIAGHGGAFRTLGRLRVTWFWKNMDEDVANHVKQCAACQTTSNKGTRPAAPLAPLPIPTAPNRRVHVDLFGPIKGQENKKGYVLVMTDAFSKLVSLRAIDDKEAETVAQAFLEGWVYTYGVPKVVLSDQGREFVNKFSAALYEALGVEHKTTSPYHPQTNAQAEVFNKTMKHYLGAVIQEAQASTLDWKLYVQPLAFSYNTAVHKSARMAPFYTVYGYDPRAPLWEDGGLMEEITQKMTEAGHVNIPATQVAARRIVHNNLQHAQEQQRDAYNKRGQKEVPNYHRGQQILVRIMQSNDPNRKIAKKWEPGTVIEQTGPNAYKIRCDARKRKPRVTVNAENIKPEHEMSASEEEEDTTDSESDDSGPMETDDEDDTDDTDDNNDTDDEDDRQPAANGRQEPQPRRSLRNQATAAKPRYREDSSDDEGEQAQAASAPKWRLKGHNLWVHTPAQAAAAFEAGLITIWSNELHNLMLEAGYTIQTEHGFGAPAAGGPAMAPAPAAAPAPHTGQPVRTVQPTRNTNKASEPTSKRSALEQELQRQQPQAIDDGWNGSSNWDGTEVEARAGPSKTRQKKRSPTDRLKSATKRLMNHMKSGKRDISASRPLSQEFMRQEGTWTRNNSKQAGKEITLQAYRPQVIAEEAQAEQPPVMMREQRARKKLAERRKTAMALTKAQLGDRPPGETMSLNDVIMQLDSATADRTNASNFDQRWAQ